MSLTSPLFFAFLAVAAAIFYAVPVRWRTPYLLALSYAFYAAWSVAYLVLLVLTTALAYAAGKAIAATEREKAKQAILAGCVAVFLALVIVFKLAGQIRGVLFPLGLSYYSFKLLSYLIDVYWDEEAVEKDAWAFFLYPAFFPQIVSGPIQRADHFFGQLRQHALAPADYARIEAGFRLILGGLMLKLLVGDRLNAFIEAVDAAPGAFQWHMLVTVMFCYTLQLYADFAGYSNIAIGIGRIFGIDCPPNFVAPFAASNIQVMWRRWHMSLTSWIADYLFLPLQMSLRRLGRFALVPCVTTSMVAIGLWHGITMNFFVFGLFHAAVLTVTALTARWRERVFGGHLVTRSVGYVLGVASTFTAMSVSQIFFHARSWHEAVEHVRLIFGLAVTGNDAWAAIRVDVADPVWICMAIAFYVGAGAPGMARFRPVVDRAVPNWLQYGIGLFLISALSTEAGIGFIYGQF